MNCKHVPFAGLLIALLILGCSSNSIRQKTYPVKGQVTIDGKAIPGATVVFTPVNTANFKWQEKPLAITDSQGNYTLRTYDTNDGAPASDYKVGIAIIQGMGDEEGGDQVKRVKASVPVPAKYADPEKSGLTAKIEEKDNVIDFKLTK